MFFGAKSTTSSNPLEWNRECESYMFWQSEPLVVPRFSFACILGTQILLYCMVFWSFSVGSSTTSNPKPLADSTHHSRGALEVPAQVAALSAPS